MKLGAELRIELTWWWEDPPAGERVVVDDGSSARFHLARFASRWNIAADLRRFLREGTSWLGGPLDDAEVLDRVATALATGRARLSVRRAEALLAWDATPEEVEEVGQKVVRPAPEAPEEEVCWPCLEKAAASARALREASEVGLPFVMDG